MEAIHYIKQLVKRGYMAEVIWHETIDQKLA